MKKCFVDRIEEDTPFHIQLTNLHEDFKFGGDEGKSFLIALDLEDRPHLQWKRDRIESYGLYFKLACYPQGTFFTLKNDFWKDEHNKVVKRVLRKFEREGLVTFHNTCSVSLIEDLSKENT